MLTVHSKSVSEIAQDEIENIPEDHAAPGNLLNTDVPVRFILRDSVKLETLNIYIFRFRLGAVLRCSAKVVQAEVMFVLKVNVPIMPYRFHFDYFTPYYASFNFDFCKSQ